MSIYGNLTSLQNDLRTSFLSALSIGKKDKDTSNETIQILSDSLSSSIHKYALSAIVKVDITIPPGQTDAPAGGLTTTPGVGTGVGNLAGDNSNLTANFVQIFSKALDSGKVDGDNSKSVILSLSLDMADSIKSYFESLQVITQDIINPGQVAAGPFGTGVYSAPSSATGTGSLKDQTSAVAILFNSIKTAYQNAVTQGTGDNDASEKTVLNLSKSIGQSILAFAASLVSQTNHTLTSSSPVSGYTTPAGTPMPSQSIPTSGTGTGNLF